MNSDFGSASGPRYPLNDPRSIILEEGEDDEKQESKGIDGNFAPQQSSGNPQPLLGENIYMSVVKQTYTNKVGIAYYSDFTEIIYVGEFNQLEPVEMLKAQLLPCIILTPSKLNDVFYQFLRSNPLDPDRPFNVTSVKLSEFTTDACSSALQHLHVQEVESGRNGEAYSRRSREELMMYWHSFLDWEAHQMIAALGGLLSYLLTNRITTQLEDGDNPITVKNIQAIPINHVLYCDKMTLSALSIFEEEYHPGGGGRIKEGLSVYGILQKTKTPGGAKLLKSWLLYPSQQEGVISNRLDQVAFFAEAQNEGIVHGFQHSLKNIKDTPRTLGKLLNMSAKLAEWSALFKTVQAFSGVHSLVLECEDMLLRQQNNLQMSGGGGGATSEIRPYPATTPLVPPDAGSISVPPSTSSATSSGPAVTKLLTIFKELKPLFVDEIDALNSGIAATIDFDESQKEQRICIKRGINDHLDRLKADYEALDQYLTDVLNEDAFNGLIPSCFKELKYVYYPQIGYLLDVVKTQVSDTPVTHLPGIQFQFETEFSTYYTNQRTAYLDSTLGDYQGKIMDLERKIVCHIEKAVIQAAPALLTIAAKVDELDAYLALGVAAKDFNLVRPQISSEEVIFIDEGWDMLQALCVDTFIPNTVSIKNETDKILILTGPNNSGKSALLKMVGIITYLAHVGSFVPAKQAVIGMCDCILSRIKSINSVTSTLSSFTMDATQVSFIMRHSTARSLLLIDEFGKGTSSFDGISLVCGVVQHFRLRGMDCPKILLTTHFHECFTHDLIREDALIRFYQMACLVQEDRGALETTLVYLYKLKQGLSNNSFGFFCASMAGVPSTLIERAKTVSHSLINHIPVEAIAASGQNEQTRNVMNTFMNKLAPELVKFSELEKKRKSAMLRRVLPPSAAAGQMASGDVAVDSVEEWQGKEDDIDSLVRDFMKLIKVPGGTPR